MLTYIKNLFAALRTMREQSVSVRGRLLLSLVSMILVAFGVLAIGLAATGVIFNQNQRIEDALALQMRNEKSQIEEEIDTLTTQGVELSRNLGRETQQLLTQERIGINGLNDKPELLQTLQDKYYGYLDTALQVSDSSGAYAIVNATTNTSVSYADTSRSGIYLRIKNIDLTDKVSQEKVLYRGIPEVGRQKALELGTQWNLEFNVNTLPEFTRMVKGNTTDILSAYQWNTRSKLSNMWEEAMLLLVPFAGADGTTYGVCGVELSEAMFELSHPAVQSEFGQMVTVLAPIDGEGIHLEQGLVGGTAGTYLTDEQILSGDGTAGALMKFSSGVDSYVGVRDAVTLSVGEAESSWAVCVLMPYSRYQNFVRKDRIRWSIVAVIFLLVMIVLSVFISRTYVQPILEVNEIPPDVEEMFDKMVENIKKLTAAERRILDLYIEGHEISEIPELAFVSMATVRKHNRSIYEKLEVASRDELMVYIDLFRKFGRIDELLPGDGEV